MSATPEQADYVFRQCHDRISNRDAPALAAIYTDDAILESPLVPILLEQQSGIVQGRNELDPFLHETTRRRPDEDDLRSLHRANTYFFDGERLLWEYPRHTPDGDQLDLVEVMELHGPLIRRHRIYWGWHGINHVTRNP